MDQRREPAAASRDADTADINWLEFWPESEFKIDGAPAGGSMDPSLGTLGGLGDYLGSNLQHPQLATAAPLQLTLPGEFGSAQGLPLLSSLEAYQVHVCARPDMSDGNRLLASYDALLAYTGKWRSECVTKHATRAVATAAVISTLSWTFTVVIIWV